MLKFSPIYNKLGMFRALLDKKSSIKTVRVNIHEEMIPISIEKGQKLNVSVFKYVSFKSKVKTE